MPAHESPHVLLVEDHPDTRTMYATFLSAEGFDVAEAENGVDGLRSADRDTPEIVVTDLAMPAMDGFEFARRLRTSVATSAVPIIAISGQAELLRERRRAEEAGIDVLLTKTGELEQLLAEIQRLLDAAAETRARAKAAVKAVGEAVRASRTLRARSSRLRGTRSRRG